MQDISSNNAKTTTGLPETDSDWVLLAQQLASGKSQALGFSATQFWERQRRNRYPVSTG